MKISASMLQGNAGLGLFPQCLRLITINDPKAVDTLEHLRTTSGLRHRAGFSYVRSADCTQSCDCGLALENFTFIKDKLVDMKVLDAVCENLDHGKCSHAVALVQSEQADGFLRYSSTTLLEAAAAAGNTQVIKYLQEISVDNLLTTPKTDLVPFHPSVTDSHVFQLVHDEAVALTQTLVDNIKVVQRCLKMGMLLELFNVGHDIAYRAASLLMTYIYAIPDRRTVRIILNTLGEQIPFLRIFVHLAINKPPGMALPQLVVRHLTRKILERSQGKQLIMASVLADDGNVLQYLIDEEIFRKTAKHGYNALDVANAFGSQRCASILESRVTPTPNVYRQLSPYNFLLLITESFSQNIDYLNLLNRLSEQGFDANFLDEKFHSSPLAVAVLLRREALIKPLIEFGIDIDNTYHGTHLIQLLLDPLQFGTSGGMLEIASGSQFHMIKTILYWNPSPDKCPLLLSVSYDLGGARILDITSEKVIKFTSGTVCGATEVFANTLQDRCLAVSAFALLHELGFSVTDPECEQIVHSKIRKEEQRMDTDVDPRHIQEKISQYKAYLDCLMRARSQPRGLKSSCRIAIRKAYPGRQLHVFLSGARIPRQLADYNLYPHLLWKTVIE